MVYAEFPRFLDLALCIPKSAANPDMNYGDVRSRLIFAQRRLFIASQSGALSSMINQFLLASRVQSLLTFAAVNTLIRFGEISSTT